MVDDRSIRMYMSTMMEVAGRTVMLKLVGTPAYVQDGAVLYVITDVPLRAVRYGCLPGSV